MPQPIRIDNVKPGKALAGVAAKLAKHNWPGALLLDKVTGTGFHPTPLEELKPCGAVAEIVFQGVESYLYLVVSSREARRLIKLQAKRIRDSQCADFEKRATAVEQLLEQGWAQDPPAATDDDDTASISAKKIRGRWCCGDEECQGQKLCNREGSRNEKCCPCCGHTYKPKPGGGYTTEVGIVTTRCACKIPGKGD